MAVNRIPPHSHHPPSSKEPRQERRSGIYVPKLQRRGKRSRVNGARPETEFGAKRRRNWQTTKKNWWNGAAGDAVHGGSRAQRRAWMQQASGPGWAGCCGGVPHPPTSAALPRFWILGSRCDRSVRKGTESRSASLIGGKFTSKSISEIRYIHWFENLEFRRIRIVSCYRGHRINYKQHSRNVHHATMCDTLICELHLLILKPEAEYF